jgi:hypothetical protein
VISVPTGSNGILVYTKLGGFSGAGISDCVIAGGGTGGGIYAALGGVVTGKNFSGGSDINLGVDNFDWNCHAADGSILALAQGLGSMVCSSGANSGCYSAHRNSYVCIYGKAVSSGSVSNGMNADTNSTIMAGWDNASGGVRSTGHTGSNFYSNANSFIRRYNSNTEDSIAATASPTVGSIGNTNSIID